MNTKASSANVFIYLFKMKVFVALLALAVACSAGPLASKKKVVCYFASWTVYRPGNGKFDVSDIDPTLCTHINFAFIGLFANASIHDLDPWESDSPDGYEGFKHLVALKQSYPDLKVMVSMGGWNEGSKTFSEVAADADLRKILADNVLAFIEKWGFDGFDLDWEYPALRNGNPDVDQNDFTELLKELNAVLKPKGYILTFAAAGAVEKIDQAYNVPAIIDLVDMINVMVFDFHGAFENFVGHLSPLYPAEIDFNYENNGTYNVDAGIKHWLEVGAPAEKLNLGIVTYGRTFTLADKTNTALYADVKGGGKAGPYTRQEGYLGYNEICEFHESSSTYVWDDEQKVPHRFWSDQWVGFDDQKSLELKVKYALEKKLGGVMIWSLDYDDFKGRCGSKYPLLTTINTVLNKGS